MSHDDNNNPNNLNDNGNDDDEGQGRHTRYACLFFPPAILLTTKHCPIVTAVPNVNKDNDVTGWMYKGWRGHTRYTHNLSFFVSLLLTTGHPL